MPVKLIYTAIPKYLHFAHDYILRYVVQAGHAPVTPYSGTFWLLDTVDRDGIRDANERYMEAADEIWVFGINTETGFEGWRINDLHVTDGVIGEIQTARDDGKPVKLHQVDVDSQSILTEGYLDADSSIEISKPMENPELY